LQTIESRFDAYLEQENRVNRSKISDTRVNACLYFIAPTGHSLKSLDIEFMKRLHNKVNLIPVIAKSDTMTNEEIVAFKERVGSQLFAQTCFKIRRYDMNLTSYYLLLSV
jgi:septin 7